MGPLSEAATLAETALAGDHLDDGTYNVCSIRAHCTGTSTTCELWVIYPSAKTLCIHILLALPNV